MEDEAHCHICMERGVFKPSPCKCKTTLVCAQCVAKMRQLDPRCRVCQAAYPTPLRDKRWTCSCSCSGEAVCFSICAAFLLAIVTIFSGGMMYHAIHGDEHSASRLWVSLLYGLGLVAGVLAVAGLCLCVACWVTRPRVHPSSAV